MVRWPVHAFTYIIRIYVREVLKQPGDLLSARIRNDLVERGDMGVRALLDGAPKRADTLVGLGGQYQ